MRDGASSCGDTWTKKLQVSVGKDLLTLNWSLSYRILQICTPGTELYTRMYPFFGHCRNMYPALIVVYPKSKSRSSRTGFDVT